MVNGIKYSFLDIIQRLLKNWNFHKVQFLLNSLKKKKPTHKKFGGYPVTSMANTSYLQRYLLHLKLLQNAIPMQDYSPSFYVTDVTHGAISSSSRDLSTSLLG